MVVENLKSFKVKNYKELFKMYLKEQLGSSEQRMPLHLKRLKEGSEIEKIVSLLNEDTDSAYHVQETKKGFTITLINFYISVEITDTNIKEIEVYYGDDGVMKYDIEEDGRRNDLRGNMHTEGVLTVVEHKSKNIEELFKGRTFFIKDGENLEKIRALMPDKYQLWGYDSTYNESKEVSRGFLHIENGIAFLSKGDFEKRIMHFGDVYSALS